MRFSPLFHKDKSFLFFSIFLLFSLCLYLSFLTNPLIARWRRFSLCIETTRDWSLFVTLLVRKLGQCVCGYVYRRKRVFTYPLFKDLRYRLVCMCMRVKRYVIFFPDFLSIVLLPLLLLLLFFLSLYLPVLTNPLIARQRGISLYIETTKD